MEARLHIRPAEPKDAPLLAALRNDPQTLLYLHDANQYSAAHTERWLAELPPHSRRYVVWETIEEECNISAEKREGPVQEPAARAPMVQHGACQGIKLVGSSPHAEAPPSVRESGQAYAAERAPRAAAAEAFVGVVRLDRIDWTNRNCMVGMDLVPAFRGRGYAQRVYAWLLEYLFAHLNMHMVYLEVLESNVRARRLYERLGFRVEGALREKVFRHGRYEDSILMSLLASEYAAARREST